MKPYYQGYPEDVGKILVEKCATTGCHNEASYKAAAGLCLSSWDNLFKGSNNNSSVIPYRPDQSFLLFSVNTFPEYGPSLYPTMPLNKEHLTRDEVITLTGWIASGAPNKDGYIKFSENPSRKKLYVANQGCDFVTIFDTETKLAMRCVNIGINTATEAPHDIFVSPDNSNWFVSYYAGSIIEKYSASTDSKVGELNLDDLSWHSMAVSRDSKRGVATHLEADGKMAIFDLETMTLIKKYQGSGLFIYPHGCTFDESGNVIYTVSLMGNFIYKVDISNPDFPDIQEIRLDPSQNPAGLGIHKPYEVDFAPDYKHYFVTCQGTQEIRVYKTSNDSLVKIIPAHGIPQTMAFSENSDYLFVTNMEDSSLTNTKSSVDIINYKTLTYVKSVYPGYQPRGLSVDDTHHCVYIADRNVTPLGPAPHHTTSCKGRNGYITIIDMNTLELMNWRTEVSVDPYSIAIRK